MGGTQSATNSRAEFSSDPDSSLPSSEGNGLSKANPQVTAKDSVRNPLNQTGNKIKPELTDWNLVQHKCRRKKKSFDECWNSWYQGKFLTGDQIDRDCDDLFETWRTCVLKQMKRERDRKGLGSPHRESILGQLDGDDDGNGKS
jgi:hypothetical protein